MDINTLQNIKKCENKDKVIELLQEAHRVHLEEFNELIEKIKYTNKDLAIHILEMQVLALSDDFKEIFNYLQKTYGENKFIKSMFNEGITFCEQKDDEVESWIKSIEPEIDEQLKGVDYSNLVIGNTAGGGYVSTESNSICLGIPLPNHIGDSGVIRIGS